MARVVTADSSDTAAGPGVLPAPAQLPPRVRPLLCGVAYSSRTLVTVSQQS